MSVLEKVLTRAISKGWIPQSDKDEVVRKIQALGQKYGFTPDDFAIAACTESYGLNPTIHNGLGCYGIIQFCPDRGGVKSIKGKSYRVSEIAKLSVSQQLDLADGYYEGFITKEMTKNMPAVRLYLFILLPVAALSFDKLSATEDLRIQINNLPEYKGKKYGDLLLGQAAHLFVGKKKGGTITINSIKEGLDYFASQLLGETVSGSSAGTGSGSLGSSISSAASAAGGVLSGIISGVINGKCQEMFPIKFSLKEAITYKGCLSKVSSATMGGNSLAYPAQAMRVNGAGSVSLADYDPSVPIEPGALGKPLNANNTALTSPWGKVRPRKSGGQYWHSGQDYAIPGGNSATLGVEVLAVADGTIVNNKLVSGYNPGTVEQTCPQYGNLFIRYAHVIPSVEIGQQVKKGDVIAKIGPYPEGGAHLHLELRKDNGKGFSAYSEEELRSATLNPALYCKK